MRTASDPVDLWRHTILLSKIVDGRFDETEVGGDVPSPLIKRFGTTLNGPIQGRIRKWKGKRESKLFGMPVLGHQSRYDMGLSSPKGAPKARYSSAAAPAISSAEVPNRRAASQVAQPQRRQQAVAGHISSSPAHAADAAGGAASRI